MRKTIAALAAAASLATASVSMPGQAQAHWRGGGAVAAGVIGGLAAGALIAGAARPYGYYGYSYPAYGYAPCHWERRSYWDGFGWRIRPVRVCY